MKLRAEDFTYFSEKIDESDDRLIEMYNDLQVQVGRHRDVYKVTSHGSNDENYFQHAIARLAYAFIKEEYTSVLGEIKKRGLRIG